MILAIDIGNTNIVLGCMEHDRILVEARMATDLLKTSDQYCVELKNLLNLYEIDPKSVEGVIISSVVPPVLNSCKTAVRKLTGKTPMIVGPGIKTGLNIQMENPAQIGSDLIVAAVAALSRFKPPRPSIKTAPMSAAASAPARSCLPSRSLHARRSCLPSVWKARKRPSAKTPSTPCAAASCWALPAW